MFSPAGLHNSYTSSVRGHTRRHSPAMENTKHKGNYKGTTAMHAKNQDMAFVNDTIEDAKSVSNFDTKHKKTDSRNG
jgi:hypothetical protein